ncbi:hypothetical protein ACUH95_00570 [Dermabacteraceae bacterium P13101]
MAIHKNYCSQSRLEGVASVDNDHESVLPAGAERPRRITDEEREKARQKVSADMQRIRDREAAKFALQSVSSDGWWDKANAADLARVRDLANSAGTPADLKAKINHQMEQTARRRYGTDLEGAIRYEESHPMMPPPDVRGGARRIGF